MARLTHNSRKEKAKRPQKWAAQHISELTELPMGKDEPIESREMGTTGPDVRLDSQARLLFPFTCECKCTEKFNLQAAIKQAKANAYSSTDWIVIHMRNDEKPTITMDGEAFFRLLHRLKTGKDRPQRHQLI